MDHIFRSKPSFQHVVEKQRLAHHRLHSETTRTSPELAHYKRTLEPVGLIDVELPKLALVRPPNSTSRYMVVGEVAQMPGKLVLIDIDSGAVVVEYTADQLELVPPAA